MSGFEGATASAPIEPVRLVVEDWIPSVAEVGRLPDASVVRRHIEDVRLAGNAGDRNGASAAKWADHAPVEFLIHGRVVGLGGEGWWEK